LRSSFTHLKVANHKRDVLLTGGNVPNGFYYP
jgi:hypothetical protein